MGQRIEGWANMEDAHDFIEHWTYIDDSEESLLRRGFKRATTVIHDSPPTENDRNG